MNKRLFILILIFMPSFLMAQEVFYDSFNDNSNQWFVNNHDEYTTTLENGSYVIDHKMEEGSWFFYNSIPFNSNGDWVIESNIKQVSGITNHGYGILWGAKDSENAYCFIATGGGSYMIYKYSDGQYSPIQPWTDALTAINPTGFVNKFTLKKVGSKWSFYINDQFLISTDAEKFMGDRIGFVVNNRMKISIQDLKVSLLQQISYEESSLATSYQEEFDNNAHGWNTSANDEASASITGGTYKLEHKRTEGQYYFYNRVPLDQNNDFEIVADIRQMNGVDNYGYGIAWGMKDIDNGFVFYITSTGYYRIYKYDAGKFTEFVEWTTALGVIKPMGSTNQFKIRRTNNDYQFFLNGSYLTSIPFEPFMGDHLGFVLTNKMSVAAERLLVNQAGQPIVKNETQTKTQISNTAISGDVFFDTFNSNLNLWPEENASDHYSRVYDGSYVLTHKLNEGQYHFWKEIPLSENSDYKIEAAMKQSEGVDYGYGLVWGAANEDNLLAFYITSNGYARVYKFENGQFIELKEWTQLPNVIKGKGNINRLKIEKKGGALTFYVNDTQVARMADQPLFGNKLGFVLTNSMTVEVDQIQIEGLKKTQEIIVQKPTQKTVVTQVRQEEPAEPPVIRWITPDQPVMQTGDRDFQISLEINSETQLQNVTLLVNNGIVDFPEAQTLTGRSGSLSLNGKIKLLPGNNDLKIISANTAGSSTSQSRSIIYNQPSPPVVTWLTPTQAFSTTSSGKIEIKAGINSTSAISSVKVLVNGAPLVEAIRGFSVQKSEPVIAGYDQVVQKDIDLKQGDNMVKLIVESQNGSITTEVRTITFNSAFASGQDSKEKIVEGRKDYALIFVTGEYDNWPNLVNPVNDGETIGKELKDNYGFETEVIKNPTASQVLLTLKRYSQKSYMDKDQLFIFFAGHGSFDETFGEGYVVCKNSLLNDEAKTSYISHSVLRTVINNIPCQHILVVMDVCFGGTFDQLTARADSRGANEPYKELSNTEFIQRKLQYKTRKYLTSGGKEYVPDGRPGQHSPFCRKLLEAFRSFGGSDNILTFGEVITYMERVVPQPRTAGFGDNEPGSEFLFIAR